MRPGRNEGTYARYSDAELVSTLADGGEPEVMGVLWDRHAGPVYSLALRILRDAGWAEEVSQDVFTKLWSSPKSYDSSRGDLRRWLLAVTHHAAVNGLRGRRGTARDKDAGPEPLDLMAHNGDDPADSASESLKAESVHGALGELPSEQREVVQMLYFDGLSQTEAADRTGRPLGTIKTRVRLGLRKLRDLLEEAGEDR